ncbi:N-acetylmuramoyl-L-alanine amidase [Lactiplantibacillus modestisalitolerans]|uniref:N-acetylmuramoyl-L-alanine amidase n=1 Tax=Lactiplantibacillus modestisalitolerans TaxID=1457219 RepID=A0ABV5WUF5_9LACO|nr:N-acetylmuramoyl-L-alanine amidase [Lactiplantibacillus modestisalitolerans]
MSYKISKKYALSGPEGDSHKTSSKFIILHDVGANSGAAANASYFKNNWRTAQTYVAFVVGDGGKVYQVGTPGYVQWGAGSTANAQAPVQIELGRTTSKSQFKKDYAAYVELARDMAKKYGIPLTLDAGGASTTGVKTHRWETDHIWGSHVDPYGYLSPMGISKAQLQKNIKNGIKTTTNKIYTVKKGDSWWKIATDHKTTVAKLAVLHGKKVISMLYPGDKIKLK